MTLVFVLLLLKVRKSKPNALIWASVPVLLATVIVTAFGTIQPLTLMTVAGLDEIVGILVKLVMDNILDTVLIGGAVGIGVGVILIVSCIIVKKNASNKKNITRIA